MSKLTKGLKHSPSCCQKCRTPREFSQTPNTVLVFGVFDLLHPGHHYFLSSAKQYGERLIVVVTRDERAEHEKGRRPIHNLVTRIGQLMNLSCVDMAVAGDKVGEWGMVRRIRPDVICVGHDQRTDNPKFLVQLEGLEHAPRIIKIDSYQRDEYSTTRLREKLFDNDSKLKS